MVDAQLSLSIQHDREQRARQTILEPGTLEFRPWSTASILYRTVHAAGSKTYIFAYSYKRISDAYDEGTQLILGKSGGDKVYVVIFPEVHGFQVPLGWRH